jgi:hypothetical protein
LPQGTFTATSFIDRIAVFEEHGRLEGGTLYLDEKELEKALEKDKDGKEPEALKRFKTQGYLIAPSAECQRVVVRLKEGGFIIREKTGSAQRSVAASDSNVDADKDLQDLRGHNSDSLLVQVYTRRLSEGDIAGAERATQVLHERGKAEREKRKLRGGTGGTEVSAGPESGGRPPVPQVAQAVPAPADVVASSPSTEEAKDIREVISEYFAPVARKLGPGAVEPTPTEIASFYPVFEMLETQAVEIYMPQQLKSSLTASVTTEIARLNKRIRERNGHKEDAISIKAYSSTNLPTILGNRNDGAKRIFINDETMAKAFSDIFVSDRDVGMLRGNRFFTAEVPQGGNDIERTVRQAWLVKVAILSCLLTEENANASIGDALRAELSGRIIDKVDIFVLNLARSDDAFAGISAVRSRLYYFLNKVVRLSEIIGEQIRILKAFWTAA